jgi:hypothetical protein
VLRHLFGETEPVSYPNFFIRVAAGIRFEPAFDSFDINLVIDGAGFDSLHDKLVSLSRHAEVGGVAAKLQRQTVT